ncbi:MAG TPA: GNAT family N-acetyltransferase [Clostridiales bacterium]|jgi:acetyltransferase, GNAT family|nr:MAG: GNAT family N-acetyltransferase [Subdoligranulum sp.]HCW81754.1 GNAT family N-acetyltransferase [Clostridiales bacterium]
MNTPELETNRLILRKFSQADLPALFKILGDEDANTFLPWFVLKDLKETEKFYNERIANEYRKESAYFYAVCLKQDNIPIGYIKASTEESYDFGYALRKEFWHNGFVTESGRAVIQQLKKDKIPYVTATHDIKNPRSGYVMQKLGMQYRYSYVEQWQPKNIPVTFRMYQLNLDGNTDRVYKKYWETYPTHFIEKGL